MAEKVDMVGKKEELKAVLASTKDSKSKESMEYLLEIYDNDEGWSPRVLESVDRWIAFGVTGMRCLPSDPYLGDVEALFDMFRRAAPRYYSVGENPRMWLDQSGGEKSECWILTYSDKTRNPYSGVIEVAFNVITEVLGILHLNGQYYSCYTKSELEEASHDVTDCGEQVLKNLLEKGVIPTVKEAATKYSRCSFCYMPLFPNTEEKEKGFHRLCSAFWLNYPKGKWKTGWNTKPEESKESKDEE